ncbi:MAG TPA: MMPL family transporter [Mycobacteriales bacterium]|jgi:RND superfamily putative drug exporter|nr:MMPL family transporter [Mycobacteriales bacterium]
MAYDTTPSPHPTPPRRLARLADTAYRRRRSVVLAWVLAAVAVFGLSSSLSGEYSADYSAHGSDSDSAQQLLDSRFPARAGQSIDVVVRTDGPVTAPEVRAAVDALLAEVADVPHVVGTVDPLQQVSPDGRTALGSIALDIPFSDTMAVPDAKRVLAAAADASGPGRRVEVGGAIVSAEVTEVSSEAIGLAAAAVILLVTFGSVVAAGLPIATALLGLGIGSALIGLLAAVVDIPDWGPQLAAMMALGVGIDYVLLMLTRYREFLGEGLTPAQATVSTVESAGRAVLVAGTTVVISMFGLFATDLNYMQGAAVATIAAVLVIMAAAVTLVPALLGFAGTNVDRLRLPGARRRSAGGSPLWRRWARLVQRRSWPAAIAGAAITLALAVPFLDVRFGFPDFGNSPEDQSSRQTYDLVSEGFGPGANGPLLVVAQLDPAGADGALAALTQRLQGTDGVVSVSPAVRSPGGDAALLTVIPRTSPQDPATERLVRDVRDDVVPAVVGSGLRQVHVGGATAMSVDTTRDITGTLPLLVGGVVGLSFLLLLFVFRSVAVAVKAGIMNILSIGAAYGVVALALQGGWFGQLIGIDTPTPLPAFIPVLMFAILFGLSMDYEVFLLSRIREFWLRSNDNSYAVAEGLAATARVITAAAAIMVAVFLAFVLSPDVILKVLGVGLATAILVDATVVRLLLVPATMQILGRANWWLPAWLDRALPQFHVEGPVHALPELPRMRSGQDAAGDASRPLDQAR